MLRGQSRQVVGMAQRQEERMANIFRRKNRDPRKPLTINEEGFLRDKQIASPGIVDARALTSCERLEMVRSEKESHVQVLNAELVELDAQVAWLKRFPQVERIIELLRGR
jgi:hypothetical protein